MREAKGIKILHSQNTVLRVIDQHAGIGYSQGQSQSAALLAIAGAIILAFHDFS